MEFVLFFGSGTPNDRQSGIPMPDKKSLELILDKLQKWVTAVYSLCLSAWGDGLLGCLLFLGLIVAGRTHMECMQNRLILRRCVEFLSENSVCFRKTFLVFGIEVVIVFVASGLS